MLRLHLFILIVFFAITQLPAGPHLREQGDATQLIVDGQPLLMLAGELGNSSASSIEYMQPIWPKLEAMNLNTLLAPVYWELLEPREGRFDFTHVDHLIHSAREHDLKLVLLWFGTWKNSMSCYAPLWVKQDQERFPRARTRDGEPQEIITPFSSAALEADARAFAALMRHIKEIDEQDQTVVMVQVENEIGMIPEARDHSELADQAFYKEVPNDLIEYLQKHRDSLQPELKQHWESQGYRTAGDWQTVFGSGVQTDELFMAWTFARYVDAVIEAGETAYSLPYYVNAALIRPGYQPGEYPSAGPLPHLLDVWRAAAPRIDFLAPDIYFKSFAHWVTRYDVSGNPLFIPEVGNDQSVTNAFYAMAEHNAMGYSPFSIESLPDPGDNRLTRAYEVLEQLTPLILKKQGTGELAGVLLDSVRQSRSIELGDYRFHIRHEYTWPYAARMPGDEIPRYGGMIIELAPDEFFIAGSGIVITFDSQTEGVRAGIGEMEEGEFKDGQWVRGRRMNGDQSHQGRHMHLSGQIYSIQRVKLYEYK